MVLDGARREPCACGGTITVEDPDNPDEIAKAVQEHNWSPRHVAWSRYQEGKLLMHTEGLPRGLR